MLIGYIDKISDGKKRRGGLLVVDIEGNPVDFLSSSPISCSPLVRLLYRHHQIDAHFLAKTLTPIFLEALNKPPDILCFNDPGVCRYSLETDVPIAVLSTDAEPLPELPWTKLYGEKNPENMFWWARSHERTRVDKVLDLAAEKFYPMHTDEPFARVLITLNEIQAESRDGDER